MKYDSVVRHDNVRISFLIAALNDLDILSGKNQNIYFNSLTKEKVFLYAGDEWNYYKGKLILIIRPFMVWSQVLSLGGTIFQRSWVTTSYSSPPYQTQIFGTEPLFARTIFEYYSYILVYIYDILIVDKDTHRYMIKLH